LKSCLAVFVLFFAGVAFSHGGSAQTYPTRPLRIIVPFAPGGSADLLSRIMRQHLTESMGQPVVVDNRPTAGGIAGTDLVAKAQPDGHTLLLGTIAGMAIAPSFFRKLPYDPLNDFAHVSLWVTYPLVMGVTRAKPTPHMPGVPPIASVLPGYDTLNSHGLHAPLKTPAAVVARLNSESARILARADVAERLRSFAMDIVAGTPEQYRALLKTQIAQWAPVVKASGARAD
jgi:tripartite-type tricarboxylate transporter receptor subunit TctC